MGRHQRVCCGLKYDVSTYNFACDFVFCFTLPFQFIYNSLLPTLLPSAHAHSNQSPSSLHKATVITISTSIQNSTLLDTFTKSTINKRTPVGQLFIKFCTARVWSKLVTNKIYLHLRFANCTTACSLWGTCRDQQISRDESTNAVSFVKHRMP